MLQFLNINFSKYLKGFDLIRLERNNGSESLLSINYSKDTNTVECSVLFINFYFNV